MHADDLYLLIAHRQELQMFRLRQIVCAPCDTGATRTQPPGRETVHLPGLREVIYGQQRAKYVAIACGMIADRQKRTRAHTRAISHSGVRIRGATFRQEMYVQPSWVRKQLTGQSSNMSSHRLSMCLIGLRDRTDMLTRQRTGSGSTNAYTQGVGRALQGLVCVCPGKRLILTVQINSNAI